MALSESERLALQLALQPALEACPEGADLLLSSVAAAAHHYRRATACTPFPSLTGPPATGAAATGPAAVADPDYRGLAAMLDAAMSPVQQLADDMGSLEQLPDQALRLLQWLLLHPTRRRQFAVATPAQVLATVSTPVGGLSKALAEATHVLQLLNSKEQQLQPPPPGQAPVSSSLWALHGTSFENMHSILHNGLLNLSGTYLQRTGATFGDGIYLARDYTTAASFSAAQQGWRCSQLGQRLRAVLLCEVASHVQPAAGGSNQNGAAVPAHYVVVTRPDAVRIAYVLLFNEETRDKLPRHRLWANPCLVFVLIYALAVLALPLARRLL